MASICGSFASTFIPRTGICPGPILQINMAVLVSSSSTRPSIPTTLVFRSATSSHSLIHCTAFHPFQQIDIFPFNRRRESRATRIPYNPKLSHKFDNIKFSIPSSSCNMSTSKIVRGYG
mmetsp:Transcript_18090/g.26861  ORF Transcript_18090/g.26861 Transcript_18090/m.26861 type:complete len:119 (+) Transcript_18090:194-550(+)